MKRFQKCNIIEKIWRCRWFLLLPFQWAWYSWIKPFKVYQDDIINGKLVATDKYEIMTNKNLWGLLISDIQIRMEWVYTHEDIMAEVNQIINKKKENEIINR